MAEEMITQHTIDEINRRMEKALTKYGPPKNQAECIGAMRLEMWEVEDAMHERKDHQIEAELYDVANVCVRYAQKLRSEREAKGFVTP